MKELILICTAIEWCQQHYASFPNFRFHVADVYNGLYNPQGRSQDIDYHLPFEDEEFDLVFLCSVFTHMLPDGVANYIKEIGRVLKRGWPLCSQLFPPKRGGCQVD